MADFWFIVIAYVIFFLLAWRMKWFKHRIMEPMFMFLMLFGIVALVQPVSFWLYSHAFSILLPSVLGYIFASHLK